ncbi:c-di-GMP-binding flagellar brake protein YcgR [Nocardioides thalensis]|uniref:C-di-GMP-binding flagellar brake protein YcgR n=1 Tax=Nocardioides thalensis TaxID=1914755 RepID=A0A853C2H1_9ACTN|nr:PilZ domain-containing protein [Nocardioides thalensis]NYJ01206.1 c-di-GMP-binding flagellar brake protein YcgR [Nocardioides thalensis]
MRAPALLQHVTLVAGGDHEAQVLDIEADAIVTTLVLSRLPEHGDAEAQVDAAVAWTGDTGRFTCPVVVRRAQRDYGPVWLARVAGPAVRDQRRSHFRAPVHVPVVLTWDAEDADEVTERRLSAVAADLSEGGLLATVGGDAPPAGASVGVTIRLDDETLGLEARVVRRTTYDGGGHGVALEFTDPGRHADRLRRAAFDAERRSAAARR